VIEQEQIGGPGAATCLTGIDLPMIYMQYSVILIEDISKSHGDNSGVAEALRERNQTISLHSSVTGPWEIEKQSAQ
jgi:hypothetical protein